MQLRYVFGVLLTLIFSNSGYAQAPKNLLSAGLDATLQMDAARIARANPSVYYIAVHGNPNGVPAREAVDAIGSLIMDPPKNFERAIYSACNGGNATGLCVGQMISDRLEAPTMAYQHLVNDRVFANKMVLIKLANENRTLATPHLNSLVEFIPEGNSPRPLVDPLPFFPESDVISIQHRYGTTHFIRPGEEARLQMTSMTDLSNEYYADKLKLLSERSAAGGASSAVSCQPNSGGRSPGSSTQFKGSVRSYGLAQMSPAGVISVGASAIVYDAVTWRPNSPAAAAARAAGQLYEAMPASARTVIEFPGEAMDYASRSAWGAATFTDLSRQPAFESPAFTKPMPWYRKPPHLWGSIAWGNLTGRW